MQVGALRRRRQGGGTVDPYAGIDFDEPWIESRLRGTDFHQGFDIKSDGSMIFITDGNLHLTDTNCDIVLTNSNIRTEAGVGIGGSETDGCILNGELVFQFNGYWSFWNIDDLTFIRKVMTVNGGSTICRGPNPDHVYRWSFADGTVYKEIDPLTDTVINTVSLSPALSEIQGSVWVPEDNCFYVTQSLDATVHRVRLSGATEQVFAWTYGGETEGMATFAGEVFFNVYGGSPGIIRLDRASHRVPIATAAHVIEYVGQAEAAGAGALSVPVPSGHAAGDLLVMFDVCNPQGTGDRVTPSGWTTLHTWLRGGASGHKGAIHWKFASSGSEPNVSLTDQGDGHLGTIVAFRGVDPTTPIPSSAFNNKPSGGDLNHYTFPPVTTPRNNCLVVSFAANGLDLSSTAQFINFGWPGLDEAAEIVDRSHAFGFGNGIFVGAAQKAVAGYCALGSVQCVSAEDFTVTASIVIQPPP